MSEKTSATEKGSILWGVVLWYIHLYIIGVCGIWLILTSAKWMTVFYTLFLIVVSSFGLTMTHRLWAHRSFEASSSLKFFLIIAQTIAGVGPIYDWVLYHRLHHKYYGTDKDPYNHKNGFISHYMSNCRSFTLSDEVIKNEIDMRDIDNDRLICLQKSFYWPLFAIVSVLLPLNIPLDYWNDSLTHSIAIAGFLRFAVTMNVSWLINSGHLIWDIEGNKFPPSGYSIFFVTKSFWPRYHYKVPWDWKVGEFGTYNSDCTTFLIKMLHELGLIQCETTTEPEDIREMLHQVSTKKMTLDEGIAQMHEKCKYNSKKQMLIRHQ